MDDLGKPLRPAQQERMKENIAAIEEVMKAVEAEEERIKNVGSRDLVHKRGEMTVWNGSSTWSTGDLSAPATIYDRERGVGEHGVVDGLRGSGKWCVLIGFNNKWIAGHGSRGRRTITSSNGYREDHEPAARVAGELLRRSFRQEKVYANRRGQGTCFFRHAELEQMGIPVMAGIYGTNPAGGGYQGISPTILLAHKNANIAVGGGGIVSGMSPKGSFDEADRGDPPLQAGSGGA
jgi:glutaconyl-CoA decarboxylase